MNSYQAIANELNLGEIKDIEPIQSLWGGYGELVRLKLRESSIIVKHIKLQENTTHPKGWNTKLSHQRKLKSYAIEVNWYHEYSNLVDERCRIPKGLKCFQSKNEWLIVMEDLAEAGFTKIITKARKTHLSTCLQWLGNFHGKFMNKRSAKLWETGTYWHLDTRPDELEVLEDIELKKFAKRIDSELQTCRYQTIVHGDAKLANFCFSDDGTKCAAVDFQYVGHGCGMKDLIYFISSSVGPKECKGLENWLLDTYFIALKEALEFYQPKIDADDVEKQWRGLFSIAWADFGRFIKGWSPDHYKINTYTEGLTKEALEILQSKPNRK